MLVQSLYADTRLTEPELLRAEGLVPQMEASLPQPAENAKTPAPPQASHSKKEVKAAAQNKATTSVKREIADVDTDEEDEELRRLEVRTESL